MNAAGTGRLVPSLSTSPGCAVQAPLHGGRAAGCLPSGRKTPIPGGGGEKPCARPLLVVDQNADLAHQNLGGNVHGPRPLGSHRQRQRQAPHQMGSRDLAGGYAYVVVRRDTAIAEVNPSTAGRSRTPPVVDLARTGRCLSRMRGNLHVRFLRAGRAARPARLPDAVVSRIFCKGDHTRQRRSPARRNAHRQDHTCGTKKNSPPSCPANRIGAYSGTCSKRTCSAAKATRAWTSRWTRCPSISP
jgi:hypothetical protein